MTDETNDPKAARKGADADHEASLARYGFGDLPVVFAIRNGDGSIVQEKAACYQCTADGFYGRGMTGTYYQEGDVIVAEFVPNEHMQPLNRAAAFKHIAWKESLPDNRAPIDISDLTEAAQMLGKNPQASLDLPPDRLEPARGPGTGAETQGQAHGSRSAADQRPQLRTAVRRQGAADPQRQDVRHGRAWPGLHRWRRQSDPCRRRAASFRGTVCARRTEPRPLIVPHPTTQTTGAP